MLLITARCSDFVCVVFILIRCVSLPLLFRTEFTSTAVLELIGFSTRIKYHRWLRSSSVHAYTLCYCLLLTFARVKAVLHLNVSMTSHDMFAINLFESKTTREMFSLFWSSNLVSFGGPSVANHIISRRNFGQSEMRWVAGVTVSRDTICGWIHLQSAAPEQQQHH